MPKRRNWMYPLLGIAAGITAVVTVVVFIWIVSVSPARIVGGILMMGLLSLATWAFYTLAGEMSE